MKKLLKRIDRYFFESVRDFWYVVPFNFVCNFADVAICVGTVMICVYIIFIHDKYKAKEKMAKLKLDNKAEDKKEEESVDANVSKNTSKEG